MTAKDAKAATADSDGRTGQSAPSYRAPAVTRAMAVIEFLAEAHEPQRLSTIARELRLPKSSCFTILSTLEAAGYVRQEEEDDAWALTLRLYYLGMKTSQTADVVSLAQPLVEALGEKTDLTSHLALLDGRSVRYALKVDSSSFVQFDTDPGRRASLHMSAVARVVIAHLPAAARDVMLAGYRFTGGTTNAFRSRREFDKALEQVRAQGYAVEDEEEALGVRCVAAPVIDRGGRCIGAIGVLGLVAEFADLDGVVAQVVDTAEQLSGRL